MDPSDLTRPSSSTQSSLGCLARVVLAALFLWIACVSILGQAFFWTVEQLLLLGGPDWPSWSWFIISLFLGMALLVPCGLLAIFWSSGPARQVALAWTIGALYVLLMAPMRLVQAPSVILANSVQIVLTALSICTVVVLQRALGNRATISRAGSSFWLATLVGSLSAYPWLMWGALGSPLDTMINLISSLLFGLLAALIMDWNVFRPLLTGRLLPAKNFVLCGFAGIALLIEMSSAFGFGGLQLLLLIVVPSFGIVAAALYRFPGFSKPASSVPAVAVLIGLLVAAPSMLIDPDEMALVLAIGSRDLLQWALYAAFASALAGWFLSVLLSGLWPAISRLNRRPILPLLALITILLGVVLYATIGKPGFHGDQLFVILKDQAELTSAAEIDDVDARRSFVYKSLVEHANTTQADLKSALERYGISYRSYYLVNGLSVDGGPLIEFWLASRPEVDRVLHNPVLRPLRASAPVAHGDAVQPDAAPWNVRAIGADRVWQELGVTGASVTVGQSDTGVDGNHPELAGNYRGRSDGGDYSWYDPWYGTPEPTDIGGHGTHTLGTILGVTTGVAPGAEWIGCVNLARNLANPALYLDCLQFMLAPFPVGGDPFRDGDPNRAADVLNNSWGCPPIEGCDADALLQAARALRQAGVFVVVSAGNAGPGCGTVSDPLAIYDEVLSVGAIDDAGSLAFFSSVGPVTADGSLRVKPDILAPGVEVLSSFPDETYEKLDGTSMAGPHVAGVVALMWSANPALRGDVERTEQILFDTASDYAGRPPACGSQGRLPHNGTGYGVVNAYLAVKAALEFSE